MKNILIFMLFTIHFYGFSMESSITFFQSDLAIELQTAKNFIREKKYKEATQILEKFRKNALNKKDENQFIQSLGLQNSIYVKQREYTKASNFLITVIDGYYKTFTTNDALFFAEIMNLTSKLTGKQKYKEAITVYKILKEKPLTQAYYKQILEQTVVSLQQAEKLTSEMYKQAETIKKEVSASLQNAILNGDEDVCIPSISNEYFSKEDSKEIDQDIKSGLGEMNEALGKITEMLGLEEGTNMADLNLSTMNLNFDAIEKLQKEVGKEMPADSLEFYKGVWESLKNNDSLLYTKIKTTTEQKIAAKSATTPIKEKDIVDVYNLYMANISLGNFYQAEKNLNIYEEMFNELPNSKLKEFNKSTVVLSYWSLYLMQKNYNKALEYAYKIAEAKEKGKSFYIAFTYFLMRDYINSEKWSKTAISNLNIETSKNNDNFLRQAQMLFNLSLLANNKYEEAKKGFEWIYLNPLKRSRNANEQVTVSDFLLSPTYGLAITNAKINRQEKADAYMAEYIQNANKGIFGAMLHVGYAMKTDTNENKKTSDIIFNYLNERKSTTGKVTALGYNSALIFKELLLNTDKKIAENYLNTEDKKLKELFFKYMDVKERAKDLHTSKAVQDSLADYDRAYNKILKERGREQLVTSFNVSHLNWTKVKEKLKPKEAAIEFVAFSPYHFESNYKEIYYGAFIIKNDSEYPEFISLCNENSIKELINSANTSNKTAFEISKMIYKTNGTKLYNLLWQPIENNLKGVHKVYYAPTGVLHNLSFDALPTKNKSFLSELYELSRVGSTINMQKTDVKSEYKKVALFGGINYDFTNNDEVFKSGINERGTNIRSRSFSTLLGTKEEIKEISFLMKKKGIKIYEHSKKDATEENLYKIVKQQQPDILHIATHAFYVKSVQEDMFSFADENEEGYSNIKENEDPMNRSGLAFAGANYFWKTGKKRFTEYEDGILTANEIATLDLSNVKLMVLSACETGIGQSLNNEGIFGLQRGLKMAGAKKLFLSLWKVDDAVTKEYMVTFYDFLISKNLSLNEAYIKTQNVIKQKHPEPYFWASFVLIQ